MGAPGADRASAVRAPQLDELVGAYPNYNEEEEERRYYRRKRLGVLKNVLAASAGGMLTYAVYLGVYLPLPAGGGGGAGRLRGTGARPQGLSAPTPPPSLPRPVWERETFGPVGLPSPFTSQSAARAAAVASPPHVGVGETGQCLRAPA